MTVRTTTKNGVSRADIYRKAAKRMEDRVPLSFYPCWSIAQEEGMNYDDWQVVPSVREFLTTFSDRLTVEGMSNDYLGQMYYLCGAFDLDFNVTALCFMAAMVEAGDA